MPTAKKRTRKATKRRAVKKTTRTATKRTAPKKTAKRRTLTAAHKKALAEGRTISATVDRYLASINEPRKRGRKASKATLEKRLSGAQAQMKTAMGVEKVLAAQQVRDTRAKLAMMSVVSSAADARKLEADFVKVARRFSESRGIAYGSWRESGVPADVLRKAGIARTRG